LLSVPPRSLLSIVPQPRLDASGENMVNVIFPVD
jgi:hypothetical protein